MPLFYFINSSILQLKLIWKRATEKAIDNALHNVTARKVQVSSIYKLLNLSTDQSNSALQICWEKDTSGPLTSAKWQRIWKNSAISKCVRYRIIQLKILHRVYITPVKCKKWMLLYQTNAGIAAVAEAPWYIVCGNVCKAVENYITNNAQ